VLTTEYPRDVEEELITVFSKTSAIGLAILDSHQRFRFVNNAVVAMHNNVPAEAFVGCTIRDILGEAASEPEARLRRVCAAGETPALEITLNLGSRTEPGYWIEKNFSIKSRSGKIIQIASLAVEVTANRQMERRFRKVAGELQMEKKVYHRLAGELLDATNGYHAALAMKLECLSRCSVDPERIPELLAESADLVEERMQKLRLVVAKCFRIHAQ
jgi:hypothetical protein